jgi:hypothetical protein
MNICSTLMAALLMMGSAAVLRAQGSTASPGLSNDTISITVTEGRSWQSYLTIFWFVKTAKQPQMAFWVEDARGKFVATIYVTRRTALQDWRALPFQKRDHLKRPSSLPVWTHRHLGGGILPIESCTHCHDRIKSAGKSYENDPVLDALTGATPRHGFTRVWQAPPGITPGTYTVRGEINHSFDFNTTYKKNLLPGDPAFNDVSGQPSVCYSGTLVIGDKQSSCTLQPVGHGHPAGSDGTVYPPDGTITTALDIVGNITVTWNP